MRSTTTTTSSSNKAWSEVGRVVLTLGFWGVLLELVSLDSYVLFLLYLPRFVRGLAVFQSYPPVIKSWPKSNRYTASVLLIVALWMVLMGSIVEHTKGSGGLGLRLQYLRWIVSGVAVVVLITQTLIREKSTTTTSPKSRSFVSRHMGA